MVVCLLRYLLHSIPKQQTMIIEHFNHTINTWISQLDRYNFEQLCLQPAPGSWSMGQVYLHLIDATGHFLKQVDICLSNNDYADGQTADYVPGLFLNNDLPDIL